MLNTKDFIVKENSLEIYDSKLAVNSSREAENCIIRLKHNFSQFISVLAVKEVDHETLEVEVSNGKVKWLETLKNWRLQVN